MNILVTGGAGFIGSHLVEELCRDTSNKVSVVDNLSTGNTKNLKDSFSIMSFLGYDVSNLQELREVFEQVKPNQVYHLASHVGYFHVLENPIDTIQDNIQMTRNICKLCNIYKSKLLFTSSSEVYGKNNNLPYKETDISIFPDPSYIKYGYALSKLASEYLIKSYIKQKKLKAVITRLFNTVGSRQSPAYGMVIPRFIEQAEQGRDLTVYGDGEQTRTFCHVEDTVQALIGLMNEEKANNKVFNIGSTHEISIMDLAKKIILETCSDSIINIIPYKEKYGAKFEDTKRRLPDTNKVKKMINWERHFNLAKIIHDCIY